ncbi:Acetolactate synthase small subunit [Serinicoccus hydrothermalis]|uniref:Acetolactate synthase small subunit n=2 Tax=Ornithinimicrobiaceae TaxID=2805590 RepID=A0A1B1NEV7_9MICO|nr:acetolactate synthase small subunit [Serinicoccus hydrothermalis]ANS79949.1 Acetolactate synthase small subunit [Serinicoccus hydrothermalis]
MTLLSDYPPHDADVPTPAPAYQPHTAQHHPTKGTTMSDAARTRHALSVLVENNPGVLARVSVLFARRNFNIDHLVVGPTEDNKVSRMTIVVNVNAEQLHKVTSQLDKLVEVIHIEELEDADAIRSKLWQINDNGPRPVGAMAAAAF